MERALLLQQLGVLRTVTETLNDIFIFSGKMLKVSFLVPFRLRRVDINELYLLLIEHQADRTFFFYHAQA